MTKEEAIMIIGNIPINPLTVDECYSISQYQEAKTIAIEALEKLNAIETIIDTDYVQEDVFKYKAIANTVKENKQ